MRLVFAAMFAVLGAASGCATLLKPQQQSISVNSTHPGAQVFVDGMPVGQTPALVPVSTSESHTITVRGENGEMSCRLESHASAGWILLDVIMTPAWLVDMATSGWGSLDRHDCMVPI